MLPPRTNPRELLPVTKSRLSRFYHFLYLKCESRGGGTQLSAQDPYGSSLAIPSQLQRCHLLISWMLLNPVSMAITSSSLLSQRSPNCFSLHSLLFLVFYSCCCDFLIVVLFHSLSTLLEGCKLCKGKNYVIFFHVVPGSSSHVAYCKLIIPIW